MDIKVITKKLIDVMNIKYLASRFVELSICERVEEYFKRTNFFKTILKPCWISKAIYLNPQNAKGLASLIILNSPSTCSRSAKLQLVQLVQGVQNFNSLNEKGSTYSGSVTKLVFSYKARNKYS